MVCKPCSRNGEHSGEETGLTFRGTDTMIINKQEKYQIMVTGVDDVIEGDG